MKITDILERPFFWRLFRKFVNFFFGLHRDRSRIIRDFGITDGMAILDVACGTGEFSQITHGKYLGIDINERHIRYAQKIYGSDQKKFLCADAGSFIAEEGRYDVALLIDATHHFSDQENFRLLSGLRRSIRGRLIVCDPIQQSKRNYIGRFLMAHDRGGRIRPLNALLAMVCRFFVIKKTTPLKFMGIESVCILAEPKE